MSSFQVDIAPALRKLGAILGSPVKNANEPGRTAGSAGQSGPETAREHALYLQPLEDGVPSLRNFWTSSRTADSAPRQYLSTVLEAVRTLDEEPPSNAAREAILTSLSELMLEPGLTMDIARLFRPLVIDLVARWTLPGGHAQSSGQDTAHTGTPSPPWAGLGSEAGPQGPGTTMPERGRKRTRDEAEDGWRTEGQAPWDSPQLLRVERIAIALCQLLPNAPQVAGFATAYLYRSPDFSAYVKETIAALSRADWTGPDSLRESHIYAARRLTRTIFRLVRWSSGSYDTAATNLRWSSVVSGLLAFPDNETRSYAAWAISFANNLSEAHRKELFATYRVGLEPQEGRNGTSCFPLMDEEDLDFFNRAALSAERAAYDAMELDTDAHGACWITARHLCSSVIDVSGILLFREQLRHPAVASPPLVGTASTRRNMRAVALAVSQGKPVLLQGPTGSGKTALVEELARLTGRGELIKVHLGDQTDSKLLLGSYLTTAVPGEFRWQPGILTQAVQRGSWILFEDINRAPPDVMTSLLSLLDSRRLFIAERGETIPAPRSFQVFGTERTLRVPTGTLRSAHGKVGGVAKGVFGTWTAVTVEEASDDEVASIVRQRYPELGHLWDTMLKCYFGAIGAGRESGEGKSVHAQLGRSITLRDLIKWCDRTSSAATGDGYRDPSMDSGSAITITWGARQRLLSDAIDCFVAMVPDGAHRSRMIERLCDVLQVQVPKVERDPSTREVRAWSLSAADIGGSAQGTQQVAPTARPFAYTGLAVALLQRLAAGVRHREPLLLVGETGAGKTTVVQHLAELANRKLVVINMSQQSDSSDLLGGFKPVEMRTVMAPIKDQFDVLFERTFPLKSNAPFLNSLRKVYTKRKWDKVLSAFTTACQMARKALNKPRATTSPGVDESGSGQRPVKRNRELSAAGMGSGPDVELERDARMEEWDSFGDQVAALARQYDKLRTGVMFSFVEGLLVKAVREGHWILLDEVNLASAETLESLSGLLQASHESLLLTEKGDIEPVPRHPDFRLFACMNPATDVGKRDLPPGLRGRFTEIFVESPEGDREDLLLIAERYLKTVAGSDAGVCGNVVDLFHELMTLAASRLYDGSGHRPHFTLRTLTRALSFAANLASTYSLRRALYEGFGLTFSTALDMPSQEIMEEAVFRHLLGGIRDPRSYVGQAPKRPEGASDSYELFQTFWVERGATAGRAPAADLEHYILTPSVNAKLKNLARAVLNRRFPVLIQGPTSSGKTSMIEYLARRTGHKFVRINNHEHTDIQEYLGSYVSDSEGGLVFREGVLVDAVRNGYWVVLDELNLAPSDVLEALNRLLDDNRELLIPETQELIKPHPHFMLFATQNPTGIYGGRKALSRAFRNRFLEMHFEDIPQSELEHILEQRCKLAPSYCKKLVNVFRELQDRRSSSRVFEGKDGYITLRDLFKWAMRGAVGYQELAENGYMILAERVRAADEKAIVKQILERECRVKIDEQALYGTDSLAVSVGSSSGIVWTKAMQRLAVLVSRCLENKEPVLLVGDTGCGKTTVCEVLASVTGRRLHIVNCQQHTETSDFLGSQRPVRDRAHLLKEFQSRLLQFVASLPEGTMPSPQLLEDSAVDPEIAVRLFAEHKDRLAKALPPESLVDFGEIAALYAKARALFEWHDGPLVQAMKDGDFFLVDEISLAEDSVLERLNSVLEPGRSLVLAEKGGSGAASLVAHEDFRILATMNPGGDFGKKELSPALRNRFTEIWVPPVDEREDVLAILQARFAKEPFHSELVEFPRRMLDFLGWLSAELERRTGSQRTFYSLRDLLSWADFVVHLAPRLGPEASLGHGLCMVFLDGLQVNPSLGMVGASADEIRDLRLQALSALSASPVSVDPDAEESILRGFVLRGSEIGIEPFFIERGPEPRDALGFQLDVPTTANNLRRVLRGLQLHRPVLMEGSPGVGKTSLILQLARLAGREVVRINLSEQTDLMDLFGSDLPVEGGAPGQFAWKAGPFLVAMERGHWVLLDELNLASQTVLEGLNSCLDHRSSVYIPELDRTFHCAPGFRVFAAQNPHRQGGGRKGLPRSFVNRFVPVHLDELDANDLKLICTSLYRTLAPDLVANVVACNLAVHRRVVLERSFAHHGQPWDFNLRDVFRWLELARDGVALRKAADLVYVRRMRTKGDRAVMKQILASFGFADDAREAERLCLKVTDREVSLGDARLQREGRSIEPHTAAEARLRPLCGHLPALEALMKAVQMGWLAMVSGPQGSGKTSLVRLLAQLCGKELVEFAMSSSVDTMELVGGYEQVDLRRELSTVAETMGSVVRDYMDEHAIRLDSVTIWKDMQMVRSRLSWDLAQETVGAAVDSMISELRKMVSVLSTLNGMEDSSFRLAALQQASSELDRLRKMSGGSVGAFEWTDGVLVRAVEEGHWMLLDNANLCSPSVLDRLNSLLEPGGSLILNECGTVDGAVRSVAPHPNFRLFMTMDPAAGEVSRAMRNRGIEIALLGSDVLENPADLVRVAISRGLECGLADATAASSVGYAANVDGQVTLRQSADYARAALERCQRGLDSGLVAELMLELVREPDVYGLQDSFRELGIGWPFLPTIDLILHESHVALSLELSAAFLWLGARHGVLTDEARKETNLLMLRWGALCVAAQSKRWGVIGMAKATLRRFMASYGGLDGHANEVLDRCYTLLETLQGPDFDTQDPRGFLELARHASAGVELQGESAAAEDVSMSMFRQSHLLRAGDLILAEVEHPAIAHIAEVLESLHTFIGHVKNMGAWFRLWDRFWRIARGPRTGFRENEMAVLLRKISKDLSKAELISSEELQSAGQLQNAVDRMASRLQIDYLPAMVAFWEAGHAPPMRSRAASDLEHEFLRIDEALRLPRTASDWEHCVGALCDASTKRVLCDGLASLYSLDRVSDAGKEDLSWIEAGLPLVRKAISEEPSADQRRDAASRLLSWPLLDLVVLRDRSALLRWVLATDARSADDKAILAGHLKLHIARELGLSSFSFVDSARLLQVVWSLESAGKSFAVLRSGRI
ncbi:P-loop containing nucleoside triphosphate hydrolase protein [Hyaloraphidium curvatum]|nr:P-loop containing nucleoside triphosphate hydrolase protein [Hyaloraphidium curvatum]